MCSALLVSNRSFIAAVWRGVAGPWRGAGVAITAPNVTFSRQARERWGRAGKKKKLISSDCRFSAFIPKGRDGSEREGGGGVREREREAKGEGQSEGGARAAVLRSFSKQKIQEFSLSLSLFFFTFIPKVFNVEWSGKM